MQWKNITFIGSSHIADESLKEVQQKIVEIQPDIITLELDKGRAYALLHDEGSSFSFRDIRAIGLKGYLFAVFGRWAEEKLGKHVGVKPGEEMKKALHIAQKKHIAVAFIDQDIRTTLRNLSQHITWKEKWRFLIDILSSPFQKEKIPFDLRTVPKKDIIKNLIKKVKQRYPNVYKVLITHRNRYMVKWLLRIHREHPDKKILAIVGAGHLDGMLSLLQRAKVKYPTSFQVSYDAS